MQYFPAEVLGDDELWARLKPLVAADFGAREVAELAADGDFHLLAGLGHGSAFGHRPDDVNACIRAILESR
jgi:hypothetical protein